MDEKLWTTVDQYLAEKLLPDDPALKGAMERNTAEGLPAIDVSALQGAHLDTAPRIEVIVFLLR